MNEEMDEDLLEDWKQEMKRKKGGSSCTYLNST